MDFNNINPFYKLIITESIETTDLYDKFINWVSGEFTLYLQDESNGLTVFFPNGLFNIDRIKSVGDSIEFKITIKSKSMSMGTQIHNQVVGVLNHLISFKSKVKN